MVSKSQKHFFLKLYCTKNEQNIRQNSALSNKRGDWNKGEGGAKMQN